MKITYDQLVEHKACPGQMELFRNIFGNEVKITKNICKKHYSTFHFEWVIDNLFPKEAYKKYYQDVKSIEAKYDKDIKIRNDKYDNDDQDPEDAEIINDKYDQDLEALHDKYEQDCVMIFYKYSLTLD